MSFEEFWEETIDSLGLDLAGSTDLYEDSWRLTYLDTRVESWVRTLRPLYQLATLSNSWSDGRRECMRRYRLDRLVDLMVFSAEEGVAKPDAEIYRRTLTRLEVAAEETLFIDDRVTNVKAAARLGMHSLHVTTPEQLVGDATAYLARET